MMEQRQDNLTSALMKLHDLKFGIDTRQAIIDHARKVYPALPDLDPETAEMMGGGLYATDKDGRRWVLHGQWMWDGMFEMNTIIRETRRGKAFNWFVGGQAYKNCKNVWGSDLPVDTLIHIPDVDRASRDYHRLLSSPS